MYRALSASLLLLLAALLVPELAAQKRIGGIRPSGSRRGGFTPIGPVTGQPAATLKLGENFEGEMKAKGSWRTRKNFGLPVFYGELSVVLKAGQTLTVSATVIGKGRHVALRVLDPTGSLIGDPLTGEDPAAWPVKTAQLTQEEVNASGKYTIQVISDLAGAYRVRANLGGDNPASGNKSTSGNRSEIDALEKRIEQLQRELGAAQKKLRSLRAKGISRLPNAIDGKK